VGRGHSSWLRRLGGMDFGGRRVEGMAEAGVLSCFRLFFDRKKQMAEKIIHSAHARTQKEKLFAAPGAGFAAWTQDEA
jgi:hypothetical protein